MGRYVFLWLSVTGCFLLLCLITLFLFVCFSFSFYHRTFHTHTKVEQYKDHPYAHHPGSTNTNTRALFPVHFHLCTRPLHPMDYFEACSKFHTSSPFIDKFFRFVKKIYLFIFRQRGKEGQREGEKHQCVVPSHEPPTVDLTRTQPRHEPRPGIKLVTPWFTDPCSIHWAN